MGHGIELFFTMAAERMLAQQREAALPKPRV
jgi:hypothetical protein